MPNKPDTFEAVFALWDTHAAFSADMGIPYVTAQVMRHRKSIGDRHWPKLIQCLKAKGVKLSTDDLLAMKQRRREAGQVAA
jgi:hypothetical protein